MITDIIFLLFQGIASSIITILGYLPGLTLPAEFINSLQTISGYIGVVDNFLPTTTIFSILGLVLAVEGAIMAYKIFQWIIKKIPGVS